MNPTTALQNIAGEINAEHDKAEAKALEAIGHALEAGRLLAEAKQQVEHGGWADWLASSFNGSNRTAQAYMRLANNREAVEANAQSTAYLSIDGALRGLAESKAPPRGKEPASWAESIALWPDMLDLEARVCSLSGMSAAQIATRCGVTQRRVELNLNPEPPIRWAAGNTAETMALFDASVGSLIAHAQYMGYTRAQHSLGGLAPHLAPAAAALARHYKSELERLEKRFGRRRLSLCFMIETQDAHGIQMDALVRHDYIAAFGESEPFQNGPPSTYIEDVMSYATAQKAIAECQAA